MHIFVIMSKINIKSDTYVQIMPKCAKIVNSCTLHWPLSIRSVPLLSLGIYRKLVLRALRKSPQYFNTALLTLSTPKALYSFKLFLCLCLLIPPNHIYLSHYLFRSLVHLCYPCLPIVLFKNRFKLVA
jgi:hypothetical protein